MASTQNIDCANRFFTITLNEQDTLSTDFMFYDHERTNQAGYRSLLSLPDTLNRGKYMLGVYRPVLDKADVKRDSTGRLLTYEDEIPFWIE